MRALLGLPKGSLRALQNIIQILISDETSQDSIAATPKTENPFYQCPHCDDNFDSFDDVTNHIEDEHENNETGRNFVSFCVEDVHHTCKNLIPMVVTRAMANSSKNHALLMCRI